MKTLTEEKKCPVCGNDKFTLCQDYTRYSVVTLREWMLLKRY